MPQVGAPTALCRSQELDENPKVRVTVKHLQRRLAVTFVQSGASRCQTVFCFCSHFNLFFRGEARAGLSLVAV